MSEYQYYEFLTVDRTLTAREQDALRRISTRARIGSTSFTNEYQWGDLKANPMDLLRRYFDLHVYVSNWGSRTFAMCLPAGCLTAAERRAYQAGLGLRQAGSRTHTLVELNRETEEPDDDWDDGASWMASLAPIRTEILTGDRRSLYLAWLRAVQQGDTSASHREPPVPAGLGSPTTAQKALISFLDLDAHLVAVAAEASARAEDSTAGLSSWIRTLPVQEKDRLLTQVAQGHAQAVQGGLLARFGIARRPTRSHPDGHSRTAGELVAAAEGRAKAAAAQEKRKRARLRKRREAEAAAARRAHLDALVAERAGAWRRVETLAKEGKARSYDEAVVLLRDLHEIAAERAGGQVDFERRLLALRRKHAKKYTLMGRLDKAKRLGWGA